MQMADFPYPGHTEFLTAVDKCDVSLMTMCSDELIVSLVTNHLSLGQVAGSLTKDLLINKINILHKTLVENFGKERPIIAVLGLNPHAGDEGALGDEEDKVIRPAIVEAKKNGVVAMGPYPGDAFFGGGKWTKVDAVLAMYHDQGLIPFKTISFGNGTNFTAGLSFIRTSPDHGTAFDIAGTNMADPSSMISSIYRAIDLYNSKKEYLEDRANPLVRQKKQAAGINE
jgi:4-hydroxythreonine-4-phosphate dehydrogenase